MKLKRIIYIFIFVGFSLIISCKSSKVLTGDYPSLQPSEVINNHQQSIVNYDNLSITFSANITTINNEQSAKCYVRLKQDSALWMSMRMMGFEGIRIYCTQDSLYMVDRINKVYIMEGYTTFESELGIPINLSSLQATFTQNAVIPINPQTKELKPKNDNRGYGLTRKKKARDKYNDFSETYIFSPVDFKLLQQSIYCLLNGNVMDITYDESEDFNSVPYPSNIHVKIKSRNPLDIDLKVKSVKAGNKTKMPFKISDKYNRIGISDLRF